MLYAKWKEDGFERAQVFYLWEDYFAETSSSDVDVLSVISFKVSGKTYQDKKECVRNIAIQFQHDDDGGLSMFEISEIQGWFQKVGSRYGLLKEFKENGVV